MTWMTETLWFVWGIFGFLQTVDDDQRAIITTIVLLLLLAAVFYLKTCDFS